MGKQKTDDTDALATVDDSFKSNALAELVRETSNPLFDLNLGNKLRSTEKPSTQDMLRVVNDLPEDLKEKVTLLLKKMDPDRPGLYLADDAPTLTELRVFQGSGNDPYRPDSTKVGDFYMTTKTNVGSEFIGTVIALWQGRTMWPAQEDTARRPICNSMDRKVGSKYGECATCMHRPWRGGQKQACGDDVVAFLLPQNLSDFVMVRFQRTSSKAGEQLATYAKKGFVPWSTWFKLTTEKQVSGERRWYTLAVDPIEGKEGNVQIDLTEFCAVLQALASHDFILPKMGFIYRSAAENEDSGDGGGDSGDTEKKDNESGDGYGDFNV